MQQWIVIAPGEHTSSDGLKCQLDHYLKLVEVFETRQTWVFNFAILVYVAALAGLGPLLEFIKPASLTPPLDVLAITCEAFYSVVLPLVILPLCYLFVDVTIFDAALSAGALPDLEERFGSGYRNPATLAFNWIDAKNESIDRMNKRVRRWHRTQRLDLHWFAHGRTFIFLLAPVAGLFISLIWAMLDWRLPRLFNSSTWVPGISLFGIAVSGVMLWMTWIACLQARKARELSITDLSGKKPADATHHSTI